MRKRVAPQVGQRSRWAAMLGMAGAAGERGTLLRDHAVQFRHIEHLRGNIGMTGRAAIGHPGGRPGSGVTRGTLGDLRVRSHAAQRITRLGIQFSGCEHSTAAGKRHADNRD